jgi:hypothetical protein
VRLQARRTRPRALAAHYECCLQDAASQGVDSVGLQERAEQPRLAVIAVLFDGVCCIRMLTHADVC